MKKKKLLENQEKMEENTFQLSEIIKIEQMPKIFTQLEKIGEMIEKKLEGIDEIACTEENKQDVKNRRTEINNTIKALETRRVEIKKKLLEPYDMFEEKYNKECKEKLQEASDKLSNKINEIESQQKEKKKKNLMDYFEQYRAYCHLENIVSFEQLKLNITLTASEKSLKESVKKFIDRIDSDLKLIDTQEHKEEIIFEYKKELNASKAITEVNNRYKQLELIKQQEEKKKEIKQQEEQKSEEIKELIVEPPKEIKQEKIYELNFKVYGTKEQLVLLKQFLESGEYRYE